MDKLKYSKKVNMKMFTNEKGATSVLVIFMMIVLVTLGTFAITSAVVNFKFANNAANWNKTFYSLENKAEIYTMNVDAAMYKAMEETLKADFVSDALGRITDEKYAEILNALYNDNLTREIETLATEQEGVAMENLDDGTIVVKQVFISDENKDAHLTVALAANPLVVKTTNNGTGTIGITIGTEGDKRFTVKEWRQWQTPVEIPNSEELWQGLGDTGTDTQTNPEVTGGGLFAQPEPAN